MDRKSKLWELEREFRYLNLVQLESRMARVHWLETLSGELMQRLREFWDAIEAGVE